MTPEKAKRAVELYSEIDRLKNILSTCGEDIKFTMTGYCREDSFAYTIQHSISDVSNKEYLALAKNLLSDMETELEAL